VPTPACPVSCPIKTGKTQADPPGPALRGTGATAFAIRGSTARVPRSHRRAPGNARRPRLLDVTRHHRAHHVRTLPHDHQVVLWEERFQPILPRPLLALLPLALAPHRSSLGPAERSVGFGSRGPSRTSRPDRASNNSPHHVAGTGWGERASRVAMSASAMLPCRKDLYPAAPDTCHLPVGRPTSRRQASQSNRDTSLPAWTFSLKTKIASPWLLVRQPLRDATP